jgi:Zn-dependent protease with chaperone function
MKRVLLFLATNLLVGALLFAVTSALGLRGWADSRGINYTMLMISSVIYGFAGAFISLGLSRIIAKWMMCIKLVSPTEYGPFGHPSMHPAYPTTTCGLRAHEPMPLRGGDTCLTFGVAKLQAAFHALCCQGLGVRCNACVVVLRQPRFTLSGERSYSQSSWTRKDAFSNPPPSVSG